MNIKQTGEHSGDHLRDVLRSFMGKGAWPVEMVSEITGIPASTIYSHMDAAGNRPNSDHLGAYMQLFGAEFVNAWILAYGMTGAHRPKAIEGCVFSNTLHAVTHTTGLLQKLAEAVDDGVIDHRERLSVPAHIFSATTFLNAVAANYKDLHA